MFGPSMLICPITTSATATDRPVYLPAGTWYDFWTGSTTTGAAGQTVTAQAPMETIPIYVRAGSIIPLGPEITYADTMEDPIELRVYTGANGSFNLYEDEGDNYSYEKGVNATIPISWDETTQNLTIGKRQGTFPGMLEKRLFNIVYTSAGKGVGGTVTTAIDKTIPYAGEAIVVSKSGQIISGGVLPRFTLNKDVRFYDQVKGKRYIVSTKGKGQWRVVLCTVAGRVTAIRTIEGTGVAVADRIPTGVYIARISYNGSPIGTKTVIIP